MLFLSYKIVYIFIKSLHFSILSAKKLNHIKLMKPAAPVIVNMI